MFMILAVNTFLWLGQYVRYRPYEMLYVSYHPAKPFQACMALVSKPQPIMLLILPIIAIHFIYSHAITYYSILYYFSNLIVSLVKLHMATNK